MKAEIRPGGGDAKPSEGDQVRIFFFLIAYGLLILIFDCFI